jgi:hypothetical protein
MDAKHSHVQFISIGDEIINLATIARVERGKDAEQTTVVVYFTDDSRGDSRYTGAQAEALWKNFSMLAEAWDVPDAAPVNRAGAGRIDRSV